MASANQTGQVQLVPELTMTTRLLPKCWNCSAPHPLARKPPADPATCPDCGSNAIEPPPARDVKAELTGFSPSTLLARLLFWIGGLFRTLAKGL